MKKLTYIVFFFWTYSPCFGQACTDTLQVSKDYKTILIFPDNIAESMLGNEFDFIVDLPKAKGSKYNGRITKLYYEELSEETKNHTNYTVITQSGNVYDFILELARIPKKLTWYIRPEMAIANIDRNPIPSLHRNTKLVPNSAVVMPMEKDVPSSTIKPGTQKNNPPMDSITKELYRNDPMEYYRLRCYYMQFDRAKISRYFSRLDNVFLWLKGIYYNEDELYFQFRIQNKEGLDMDVNFIKFSMASNYKNSGSNQKLELKPLFIYKQPKTIEGKSENHFVVVFKKFALDEKKEMIVELDEESGNRNLSLKIGHEIINNPIHF